MLTEYFIFLASYFIIDMLWIRSSSSVHKKVIEGIQKSPMSIDMVTGAMYYLILSAIVIYTLSRFARNQNEWFLLGFLMLLAMFLTFDMTNKTIFKEYPYWYMGMDVIGGVSSGMLALLITWFLSKNTV